MQNQARLGKPENHTTVRFDPESKTLGATSVIFFTQQDIKNEPMLYSADPEFARDNGGPILNAFLNRIPEGDYSIDVRVHMLLKGWYPAIPGWHIDALRRPEDKANTSEYQPIWQDRPAGDVHYLSVLGETAMPEFVNESVTLMPPNSGENVYAQFSKMLDMRKPETLQVKSGEIFRFGSSDFHRATPAETTTPSFRVFLRASDAEFVCKNEIRNQVQVYRPLMRAGKHKGENEMATQTHAILVDNEVVDTAGSYTAACREVDWLQRQGLNAHLAALGEGWHLVSSWSYSDEK